ncbi:MAG: PD-(D/E)XK nuclease family protein [Sphaerochaetaceae bacterium]
MTSVMETRRQTIHRLLQDPDTVCVFPSESTARFWLADFARKGADQAVLLRQAISWDTFWLMFLPHHAQRPANRIIHHLFALRFLEQSAADNGLAWFVDPTHPENNSRFASSVAHVLPQLEALRHLRETQLETYSHLPLAMRHDISLIDTAYRDFLHGHGMFEPSFEHPSATDFPEPAKKYRYAVCFPQITEGWQEFERTVGDQTWITAVQFPQLETYPPVEIFENELVELRVMLRRIEALLQKGISCGDIAITAADLDSWRPYLIHEAAVRDIPLNIVGGKSPLEYPAGRFLNRLRDVGEHAFSLDTMKELLLDPSYPWEDLPLHRRLIARAVELHIQRGAVVFQETDDWEHRLSRYPQDREFYTWYQRFKATVKALMEAQTVSDIRKRIFFFQDEHFITDRWTATAKAEGMGLENQRVFSFCLGQLENLQVAMDCGGFKTAKGLFNLYLQLLQNTRYVPQHPQGGIPVYPYRLVAGILPRYHFVVGCAHETTRQIIDETPVIPESFWDQTAVPRQDMSNSVLGCYCQGGEQVLISFGRNTFRGTVALPPTLFLEQGQLVVYGEASRPVEPAIDLPHAEENLWADVGSCPVPLHRSQKKWFNQASRTLFAGDGVDFTYQRLPSGVGQRVLQGDGLLHVSATSIDTYLTCPSKWAARYLFNIEEADYEVDVVDHKRVGTLLHDILALFFKEITDSYGAFSENHLERYHLVLNRIMDTQFALFATAADAPSATTVQYLKAQYATILPRIVEAEARHFTNFISLGYEQSLGFAQAEKGYMLEGRIDRVLQNTGNGEAGGLAVVDYKKNYKEAASTYLDPAKSKPSVQLPVYARLLQAQTPYGSPQVASAAFYDIAKGEYRFVWDDGSPEKAQMLLGYLEEQLDRMVASISMGDFQALPSKEHCSMCSFRQICRRRYTVR